MLPSLPVKWAEFAPDQSDYNPNVSDAINNVYPTVDGYGSLPSWTQYASATLGATPLGGFTARKADGSTALIGGTIDSLFLFNASTNAWDDISGATYAVPGGNFWQFTQFGSRVIACNGSDATQYYDVDSGSAFANLTNAPAAKFCATVGDFLVLFNLPNTSERDVAWSGVNDSEFWTYGQRGSDLQPIPSGGDGAGLIGTEAGFIAFQQDKINLFQRVAGQAVFARSILHENIGCFAPYSVCGVRNSFFWYDQGGFYEGFAANPVGAQKVNRYVIDNSEPDLRKQMRGIVDPVRKIAWWLIQKTDLTYYMLGYNWIVGKWTKAEVDMAFVFSAIAPGVTVDTWDTFASTVDTLPYTVDSAVWDGSGVRLLAGFDSDGDFGYFESTALEATLETNDLEINPGGSAFVNAMRLVSDAGIANVSGQIASRQFPGDALSWSTERAADTNTGLIWPNPGKHGRSHRARCIIASSSWNNTNGVHLFGRPAGF